MGDLEWVDRGDERSYEFCHAARAYFEAHPERKPRAWTDADVITWRDGAYLPQIAQKDTGHSSLGWRYSDETDARWYTEDELASFIGDADVTVLVAAKDAL